jgi:peroxiredoxin
MAQFEPLKSKIEAAGSLIYIAAEKRGGMFKPEKYLAEHPISFPFLLDEDRAVTKAYGVYQRLRLDAINIARPATFVIDRNGAIRYIYVGSSQFDRAPTEEVLSALASAQ